MRFVRTGDFFAYGCFAALIVTELLKLDPTWAFGLAFVGGWAINEQERKRVEQEAARR